MSKKYYFLLILLFIGASCSFLNRFYLRNLTNETITIHLKKATTKPFTLFYTSSDRKLTSFLFQQMKDSLSRTTISHHLERYLIPPRTTVFIDDFINYSSETIQEITIERAGYPTKVLNLETHIEGIHYNHSILTANRYCWYDIQ